MLDRSGRLIRAALVGALPLALTACGGAQGPPSKPPPPTAVAQLVAPGAPSAPSRADPAPVLRDAGPPSVAAPSVVPGSPSVAAPAVVPSSPAAPPPIPGDAAAGGAQDGPTTTHINALLSQLPPPPPDEDLPIGPGDLIEISVFEVEELSKIKVRIPMRGTITLPLIGPIPAAGHSALELQDEISQRLAAKYMHNPQVSVFVHEHNSQRISVSGAVKKGGIITITSRLRLADALASAEGLADDADHTIYLIRRVPLGTVLRDQVGAPPPPKTSVPPLPGATEEIMVAINLEELAGGRQELNVVLKSGDIIHVPRAGSYYVGGEVVRPGPFFLKSKTTIQQAVTAAGGPKDVADWGDIRLYRVKPTGEREVLTFSLNDIEKGQAPLEVQKHDVIVVGKSHAKAFWYGVYDFFKGILGVSKPI